MAELENPVIKDDDSDAIDQKFMEAAALADRGQDIPDSLIPKATDELTATEETKPEAQSTDRPRDDKGRFTKRPDGSDIPENEREPDERPAKPAATTAEPTKPQSEFEAAKKSKADQENERKDRSWKAINEQKDEIARARAELEQQRQQLQQVARQPRPQQQRKYTSRDLAEAAQEYRKLAKAALQEGDLDKFNENDQLADAAIQHAQQFAQLEAQEAQQEAQARHQSTWQFHMTEAIKSEPELSNPESPISKAMTAMLEQNGQVFWMIPDGFKRAVEIVKLQIEAGSAKELRQKTEDLQKEIERLNEQLTPTPGGAGGKPAGTKKFEDMNDAEQEAYLATAAAKADSGQ